MICVIESQYQAKKACLINSIFDNQNSLLYFKHRQSFKLRILIYQNEILETIANSDLEDDEKWTRQFDYLRSIDGELYQFKDEDVEHIKSNFSSFESYYNAIKIMGSLTFDPLTKKRWT